jgi:pyrrolysyl-tRNA synthetase-like protein
MVAFSETQRNRLIELGLKQGVLQMQFSSVGEREAGYQQVEKAAVKENRSKIKQLTEEVYQPKLCSLQHNIEQSLYDQGFAQVTTPTIISRKFLERMSIDGTHPLNEQVFWLDNKTCLRPMLAPNLYEVSKKMMNYSKMPLRLFEIGSCFRKETEGKSHLKEFTMLNLVEWGTPEDERIQRLKELAEAVLKAAQIKEFGFENEDSVIYGRGLDIIGRDGTELASSSMGPHPLDAAWNITCTWVGIGFGLERLLMYREGEEGIHRYSRSITYQDGAVLNIK